MPLRKFPLPHYNRKRPLPKRVHSMFRKLHHKFLAKPTEVEGRKFPSRLEASVYQALKQLESEGLILFTLRQVHFDLPGKTRYTVDFLAFTPTDCYFIEAKGRDLPEGKLRRKITEDLYNVPIHIITKPTQLRDLVKPQGGLAAPEHEA